MVFGSIAESHSISLLGNHARTKQTAVRFSRLKHYNPAVSPPKAIQINQT
jgi:hypothetical protein